MVDTDVEFLIFFFSATMDMNHTFSRLLFLLKKKRSLYRLAKDYLFVLVWFAGFSQSG